MVEGCRRNIAKHTTFYLYEWKSNEFKPINKMEIEQVKTNR